MPFALKLVIPQKNLKLRFTNYLYSAKFKKYISLVWFLSFSILLSFLTYNVI